MSDQRKGGGKEGLADMRMHIGGGPSGDRQGMQLVENDTMEGGVDGVSLLLGATSDMSFVGSRTRARADEIQEKRVGRKVLVSGLFNRSGSDHYIP